MSLHWDMLRQAINETQNLDEQVARAINDMLELAHGNLRKASAYKLRKLKRELQQFNSCTGKWRS